MCAFAWCRSSCRSFRVVCGAENRTRILLYLGAQCSAGTVVTLPSSDMGCRVPFPQTRLPKSRLYSATNSARCSQVWKHP